MAKGPVKRRRYHKENLLSVERRRYHKEDLLSVVAILCVSEWMLVTWMKSNLSTKALLESKLGSRVEESLPKKKKKGKRKEEGTRETRRAAKAAKSRGGRPKRCCRGCLCPGLRAAAAVGAGRAAVTLAAEGVTDAAGTGHGPVSGAGAGHPAAVVQRHPLTCQWQSQGTVGAKSRRRSFMEEQGLLWPRPRFPPLQRDMASTTARSPSGGLQLMAAEALAATPEDLGAADLEPAWQWQFRQMEPGLGPAKGEGLEQMAQEGRRP